MARLPHSKLRVHRRSECVTRGRPLVPRLRGGGCPPHFGGRDDRRTTNSERRGNGGGEALGGLINGGAGRWWRVKWAKGGSIEVGDGRWESASYAVSHVAPRRTRTRSARQRELPRMAPGPREDWENGKRCLFGLSAHGGPPCWCAASGPVLAAGAAFSHVHVLLNWACNGLLVAGRASEDKKESVAALDEGDIALLKSFVRRRTTMAPSVVACSARLAPGVSERRHCSTALVHSPLPWWAM